MSLLSRVWLSSFRATCDFVARYFGPNFSPQGQYHLGVAGGLTAETHVERNCTTHPQPRGGTDFSIY